jgi:RNA polymerase sigma-70 factor (ECF subfamily)
MGRKKKGRIALSERDRRLESVVTEHETGLLRYATRLLHNPGEAQDVVQNTFVKLARAWQNGARPNDRLRGWLYRVTHNEAIDHIRRESRRRRLHEQHAEQRLAEPACADGEHCAELNRADRNRLIMTHINALKSEEQQVLLLRLEEGLTYREIAAITGRTPGNVGCLLHHAVRKLSQQLQKSGVVRIFAETSKTASGAVRASAQVRC